MTLIILFLTAFTSFFSMAPVRFGYIDEIAESVMEMERKAEIDRKIDHIKKYIDLPWNVNTDHLIYMYDTANDFNIPVDIAFRLIRQESMFNPKARSFKGAEGYMQLMPLTYRLYYLELGFPKELMWNKDPYVNIYIGMYYLNKLADYWNNWDLALASYNAGIGRVIHYKGVPPFRETRSFVAAIQI